MLAAACAVGVGCCFAAPIGGRDPPAHTPCSQRGQQDPTQSSRQGTGTAEAAPLVGVPAVQRIKGEAGTILLEV